MIKKIFSHLANLLNWFFFLMVIIFNSYLMYNIPVSLATKEHYSINCVSIFFSVFFIVKSITLAILMKGKLSIFFITLIYWLAYLYFLIYCSIYEYSPFVVFSIAYLMNFTLILHTNRNIIIK